MGELKPCPFCGHKGELEVGQLGERFVRCSNDNCEAGLGGGCWSNTDAGAIEAWNTRVPDTRLIDKAIEFFTMAIRPGPVESDAVRLYLIGLKRGANEGR